MKEQKPNNQLKTWAKFSTIAIQMGATIFLGNLLGAWLDEKFALTFLETTITLIAVFVSMYSVIKAVKDLDK